MQQQIPLLLILLFTLCAVPAGAEEMFAPRKQPPPIATEPFLVPGTPPGTTITAASMRFAEGRITLDGNVRAVREPDLLTSGLAHLYQDSRRLHATLSPRLFRKESLPEKKSTREMTLDATDIVWNDASGTINASSAVTVRLEERTWDLATYSWLLISSDAMEGDRDTRTMHFSGNVKVKDRERFGQARHLDYDRASSTVTLSGDAMVETEEWSPKEQRMVKRKLNGQVIRYDTETKAASSE
ncbi:MAG TPA: hypothetical protein PLP29_07680 [Candidatus Ozemobacteraceae bacterium]|nr:hypothetical protein [Candidatus Ozemobacteraceae bacterium]